MYFKYLLSQGRYNKPTFQGVLMQKVVFFLLFITTLLFSQVTNINVSPDFVKNSGIRVVDIRTQPEWIQTGVVENAVLITFFDARGNYDAKEFLYHLEASGFSKDEEFALICRTGNRTKAVSAFLSEQGYKVINLRGGIKSLIFQGYEPKKYTP